MTEKEIIAGNKIIVEFDTNAKKITAVMSEKLPYDLWEHKQQFSPVGINQLRYHIDRKSTRLNSSHEIPSRMPSSA